MDAWRFSRFSIQEGAMSDFPSVLVGIAALAALALVLLAHDWRDDLRQRDGAHRHPLRDWWMRHRH
jgi:hypothetical protein